MYFILDFGMISSSCELATCNLAGYSHEDTKAEIDLVAKHMRVPRALPSAPNVVILPPLASVSIYDLDQDDGHITLACFEAI